MPQLDPETARHVQRIYVDNVVRPSGGADPDNTRRLLALLMTKEEASDVRA